MKFGIGVL